MFKDAPENVVDILANEDVTVNAHQFCIVDKVGVTLCFFIIFL